MKPVWFLYVAGIVMSGMAPAQAATVTASDADDAAQVTDNGGDISPSYLQCVPYARQVTGIKIYGDAHTWWDQAEGRYARGSVPKVGAVMNFRPYANSHLGHVAAVSRIVDPRTVLVRHANWSPINGRRGQIEDNVQVVDVSPDNDWSEVRVWYDPIQALGGTHWPLYGFIYKNKPKGEKPNRQARDTSVLAASFVNDPIGAIIARNGSAAPRKAGIGRSRVAETSGAAQPRSR